MNRNENMKSQIEMSLPRDLSDEVTVSNPNHLIEWVRHTMKSRSIKSRQLVFIDNKNGAAAASIAGGAEAGSNLPTRRGHSSANNNLACYLLLRPSQQWLDLNWISNARQEWFDIIQTLFSMRSSFISYDLMSQKKTTASKGADSKKSIFEIQPLDFYASASRAKPASEQDFFNMIESGNAPKSPTLLTLRVPVFETSSPAIVYLLLKPESDGAVSARLLNDEAAFLGSSKSQLEIVVQELKSSFTAIDADLTTVLRRIQSSD